MVSPSKHIAAVAWLREQDWPRWAAVDPQLQLGYDHWLRRMKQVVADLEKSGRPIEKVDVDLAAFLEWTNINGGDVDTKARAKFAAFLSMKRHSAN